RGLPIVGDLLEGVGLKKRGLPGLDALPLDMVTGLVKGAVPNVGLNKNIKRNDDDFDEECEEWADEDHGHNSHDNHDDHDHPHHGNHDGHPPHHGNHDGHPPHHGNHDGHPPHHSNHHGNGPCDCDRGHHSNNHNGHSSHGDLDLDVIVKAKIDIIAKSIIGITVDALIDIKADICAKILLKLNLDVDVDVELVAKIRAIVHAKIDAAVKVYVNAGIRATIGDSVRRHCHSGCGSDTDSGILADVTARLKLDIGKILVDLDADIMADIRVNLQSLGLRVKANVALALDLNLKVILGGLVDSCNDASAGLLIALRAAVRV
ncbi:hypothetical protein BG003_001186, partial [Podila horticola]